MEFTGLIYFYSLTCVSIIASILIAGFSIAPAYAFFEKRGNEETARKKSLALAIGVWMVLQAVLCLLIFLFNQQLLV
ncbi:MAG: hypothetical protein ACM3PS_12970 [Syntrophothermus sp.]